MDLAGLRLMEGDVADEAVDFCRRQFYHLLWCASPREQSPSGRTADLLQRADRDKAGDKLLEEAGVAIVRQFEQHSLGQRPDGFTYTLYCDVYVEKALNGRRLPTSHASRIPGSLTAEI